MLNMQIIVLSAILCMVTAYPVHYGGPSHYTSTYYHEPSHGHHYSDQYEHHKSPYHFEYGVADHYHGTRFDRQEKSDGDVVHGSYSVDLPDGRTQHVHYTADHYGGFNAKVTYDGKAHHPPQHKTYAHHHGYEHHGYEHHDYDNHEDYGHDSYHGSHY